jgi:8-oxo-dGTP diphosphatase
MWVARLNLKASNCVSGIIISKGKVLVERRSIQDAADPALIAIPGGHVETGESVEDAIVREMREELGIAVKKTRFVGAEYWVASDGERQRIHYFVIEEWEGKLRSQADISIFWESETSKLGPPDKRIMKRVFPKSQATK